jgi:type I pantothenate kinase
MWRAVASVPVAPARSGYVDLPREQWATLRDATPLTLSEEELRELVGLNEPVSLDEVADVYLPLSRLLSLHVEAARERHRLTAEFLGALAPPASPFVIGIAGSVAAGKSTTARILRALLARWPEHPQVELVTTDGFLLPNAVLEERGLMRRKGFPESYDLPRLVRFIADVKAGCAEVEAPVYSHLVYDIVPGATVVVRQPDVLIVEGLNVLQRGSRSARRRQVFVSDFFDFAIYVDAAEGDLRRWYVERFLRLRETAFRDRASYFRRYADLPVDEAVRVAERLWREINAVNLRRNILPTRERADLILEKGPDHRVERVRLRQL